MKTFLIICLCFVFCHPGYSQRCYSVYSDYPGGNGLIEKISGDTLYMRADLRDTEGDWFYWNFGVKNAAGRTLTFVFTRNNRFTDQGVAFSTDQGMSWQWLNSNAFITRTFSYTFPSNDEVRFSMSMPYTQKNWENFITPLLSHPLVTPDVLCTTRKGRKVEMLYINKGAKNIQYRVIFTARHHACEMMANYVMEGIIRSLLTAPSLQWLRTRATFLFIPFVDKDGVEDGDQGKNRIPRDHNRDYSDSSIHVETAALRKFLPEWEKGKPLISFDLHCPYIYAAHDRDIYIVGSQIKENTMEQEKYHALINSIIKKDTVNYKIGYLPFGILWNTGANNTRGRSFSLYSSEELKSVLAVSFEFPYGSFSGIPVSREYYRLVGKHIAFALQQYLKDTKAPAKKKEL